MCWKHVPRWSKIEGKRDSETASNRKRSSKPESQKGTHISPILIRQIIRDLICQIGGELEVLAECTVVWGVGGEFDVGAYLESGSVRGRDVL